MLAALENWWRTPPALRPVEPVASSFSRSSRTTSVIPRRERWYATEAPIQPPPTITTSAVERTRVQGDVGFLTHDECSPLCSLANRAIGATTNSHTYPKTARNPLGRKKQTR